MTRTCGSIFVVVFTKEITMSENQWDVVYEANGLFQAELLRGLLEAQEIPVVLSQEGAGKVFSMSVGTLGLVQILVPVRDFERARQLLADYDSGKTFEVDYPPDEKRDDLPSEFDES
jgi:hypothetical protein